MNAPPGIKEPYHENVIWTLHYIFRYYRQDYNTMSKGRKATQVEPKRISCYLLRKHTELSLSQIAWYLNYSTERSVSRHAQEVKNDLEYNSKIKQDIAHLTEPILAVFNKKYLALSTNLRLDLTMLPVTALHKLKATLHSMNQLVQFTNLELDQNIAKIDRYLINNYK